MNLIRSFLIKKSSFFTSIIFDIWNRAGLENLASNSLFLTEQ